MIEHHAQPSLMRFKSLVLDVQDECLGTMTFINRHVTRSRYTSLLPASITTFIPSLTNSLIPSTNGRGQGSSPQDGSWYESTRWSNFAGVSIRRSSIIVKIICTVSVVMSFDLAVKWSLLREGRKHRPLPGVRRSRTRSIEFQQWILSRFNESRAGNMDFSWSVFRNRDSRIWIDPEYWRINWCLTPALQSGYQIMCSRVGNWKNLPMALFSMKLVSHSRGSKRTWDVESWCYLLLC